MTGLVEKLENLSEGEIENIIYVSKLETEDLKRLKKMAQGDAHVEWLWVLIRRWATMIAIVAGAIAISWDSLKNLIQAAVGSR